MNKSKTYKYTGICLCGLEHYSRGYSTISEAHDDILRRCIAGVVTTGHTHSFRVAQCVRASDDDYDYRVIYQGKVQKTRVEYTLFKGKTHNKIINQFKNKLIMKVNDYFSDTEIRFLGLSPEEVTNIASKCAEAVNQNYSNGDTAVQTAVANASNGLVTVRVTNKKGEKTDGYVCLQHWDLYGKVHCKKLLTLSNDSKMYNRLNGTIKIEKLEKKIREVHTLGNRQLREIQGASIMKQVSAHMTQGASCNTPVTVTRTTNTSAATVGSSAEELEDATVYVERLAKLIVSYVKINDDVKNLLDIKDIGSLIKTKSKELFTATIKDEEIVISALSTGSYKTVTLDGQDDTINDELYCTISELLICMSFMKHDVVSSIVKIETLTDILQTLLPKRSLRSKSVSFPLF